MKLSQVTEKLSGVIVLSDTSSTEPSQINITEMHIHSFCSDLIQAILSVQLSVTKAFNDREYTTTDSVDETVHHQHRR